MNRLSSLLKQIYAQEFLDSIRDLPKFTPKGSIRIAFIGTHGTGKTTTSDLLKEVIQNCQRIGSATRECRTRYPGVTGTDFQRKCKDTFLEMVNELKDFSIISERSLFDDIAYIQVDDSIDSKTQEELVHDLFEAASSLNWDIIFYTPPNISLVQDIYRPSDLGYQQLIDDKVKELLPRIQSKTPVIELQGSTPRERVEFVIETLLQHNLIS